MKHTLNDIRQYFGYESAEQFRKDWMRLSAEDKDQIRTGLDNGTENY